MKRIILIAFAVIGFVLVANAQTPFPMPEQLSESAPLPKPDENIFNDMVSNNAELITLNTSNDCWAVWGEDNNGNCCVGCSIRYDNWCGETIYGALYYKVYENGGWSKTKCTTVQLSSNRSNAYLKNAGYSNGYCYQNFKQNEDCR